MKAILFDLYGVFMRIHDDAGKAGVELAYGIVGDGPAADEARAQFWDAYWDGRYAYDAGQATEAYWAEVAELIQRPIADRDAVVAADLASWANPDPEMIAFLGELADQVAGRAKLALLSNIPHAIAEVIERDQGEWLDRLDRVFFSCRLGLAKPDREAFLICAEELGVPVRDVLFVDDTEVNVVAARDAGLEGFHFTGSAAARAELESAITEFLG